MVPLEGVPEEGEDFQKFQRIKDVSMAPTSKLKSTTKDVQFEKMSTLSKGEEYKCNNMPRTPNQQNVKPVEITKSGGHCSDEILYLDIKEVKIPKGKY